MFSSIRSFFSGEQASTAAAPTPSAPQSPAPVPSWAHVTVGAFEGFLKNSSVPVLVDFTASWCGPCRQLGPQIDRVADRNPTTLRVVKVDMDQAPHLGQRYRVTGLPTVLLFKNGQEVGRFMGVRHEKQIQAFVDPFLV